MNSGLTEREQEQYKSACEEAEFHRLLIYALRRSQSTFEDCNIRFRQYLDSLIKLQELHERDKWNFEKRIYAAKSTVTPDT